MLNSILSSLLFLNLSLVIYGIIPLVYQILLLPFTDCCRGKSKITLYSPSLTFPDLRLNRFLPVSTTVLTKIPTHPPASSFRPFFNWSVSTIDYWQITVETNRSWSFSRHPPYLPTYRSWNKWESTLSCSIFLLADVTIKYMTVEPSLFTLQT